MMVDADALERLCEAIFVGPMRPYRESLSFEQGAGALAPADLADPTLFDALLTRFRREVPGGDARAAISFWSQHYFARLLIPLTLLLVGAGRDLPLDLRRLRVTFCPDRGTPLILHLAERVVGRPGDALFTLLFEEQVAPTVALLKRHSGLSARLLWENAGWYTAWTLGEMARAGSAAGELAQALLRDPGWPRPQRAGLTHLKRAALDGHPPVRRLCCLRYRLPGAARCAGNCPIRPGLSPAT